MRTEISYLFLQKRLVGDSRSKSARSGNRLFHRQLCDVYRILSAQFLPRQQTGFVEHVTGKSGRSLCEIKRCRDTRRSQFGFRSPTDAPHIADLESRKRFEPLFLCPDLTDTMVTRVFLGVLGCHFCKRLGRRYTDRNGNANSFADVLDQLLAKRLLLLRRNMIDIEETLVNGVLLKT